MVLPSGAAKSGPRRARPARRAQRIQASGLAPQSKFVPHPDRLLTSVGRQRVRAALVRLIYECFHQPFSLQPAASVNQATQIGAYGSPRQQGRMRGVRSTQGLESGPSHWAPSQ